MERNGKIYCDECHCEIDYRARRVRIPYPQIGEKPAKPDVHFHNRDAGDCWTKVKKRAETRKAALSPSQMNFGFKGIVQ